MSGKIVDRGIEAAQGQLQCVHHEHRAVGPIYRRRGWLLGPTASADTRYCSGRPLQKFFQGVPSALAGPGPALLEVNQRRSRDDLLASQLTL